MYPYRLEVIMVESLVDILDALLNVLVNVSDVLVDMSDVFVNLSEVLVDISESLICYLAEESLFFLFVIKLTSSWVFCHRYVTRGKSPTTM
jgi:hypothetical protein